MYYKVKVKVTIEDDKTGKMKKHNEEFIVDAVSVTDVEVIVTEEYKGATYDWEVASVSETKIIGILSAKD